MPLTGKVTDLSKTLDKLNKRVSRYEEKGVLPSALRKASPPNTLFTSPKRRRTYIHPDAYKFNTMIPEETSNDSGKKVRFNLSALGEDLNQNQKYFSPAS